MGPLSSTGDRHKSHEATTTQDYGITVDYIFYSTFENVASQEKHRNSRKTVPTGSSEAVPDNIGCTSRENTKKNHLTEPRNLSEVSKEFLEPSSINITKKYDLKLDKRLSLCSGLAISKANGLPNSFHSSDHLPVAAKFFVVDTS